MTPGDKRCLFITGIPGAGKTTLSGRIAKRTGRVLLSAHDLVEALDPLALAEGRMADEDTMRAAFVTLMDRYHDVQFVMDGWPRNSGQGALLNGESLVLHLRCPRAVAVDRLLRRGRSDDTVELVGRRLEEQTRIFNEDWIRGLAPWAQTLNTANRRPADVEALVMAFLTGERREIF